MPTDRVYVFVYVKTTTVFGKFNNYYHQRLSYQTQTRTQIQQRQTRNARQLGGFSISFRTPNGLFCFFVLCLGGRLDGLRIVVLHILVADASDRIARTQRDYRGDCIVARNRTANNGPHQNGAETEKAAAHQTVDAQTVKNDTIKTIRLICVRSANNALLREYRTSFRFDILQMRPVPQKQRCADERVQQQKVGDIFLREETTRVDGKL